MAEAPDELVRNRAAIAHDMAVMQGINVALTSVIGLGFGLLFFPGLPLWLVFPFALVLILVWSGAVRLLLCLSRTASAGPRTWPDEDLAR